MSIRIFETDPDAVPKRQSFTDDVIGRFHSGRMVGNAPEALSEWRITTADRDVADAAAQLFGGQPEETDSTAEFFIELLTDRKKVPVILDGLSSVTADMKLWNRSTLVHHCDGIQFLSPDEEAGQPCGCPVRLEDRKALAKKFMGPSPSISVLFRLADDPDLGTFRFQTGSWKFAESLPDVENALERIGAEALCSLELQLVEYTTKKGRDVSYVMPVLKPQKSWNDAVAE